LARQFAISICNFQFLIPALIKQALQHSRTREPDGRRKGLVIETPDEYQKAQQELCDLETRLERLQKDHPMPAKGPQPAASQPGGPVMPVALLDTNAAWSEPEA
jgi:hypothetical protein